MTTFDGKKAPPAVAEYLAVAKLSTAMLLTVQQSQEQLSTSAACKRDACIILKQQYSQREGAKQAEDAV